MTLRLLSLNDNQIRSAGAEALATALYDNETLQTLRLANNDIGSRGGKKLKKMLRYNESIREIILDGNAISSTILDKIDDKCKMLTSIDQASTVSTAEIEWADLSDRADEPSTNSEEVDKSYEREGSFQLEETGEGGQSNDPKMEQSLFGASFYSDIDISRKESDLESSLFGSSFYLKSDDARKYFFGSNPQEC